MEITPITFLYNTNAISEVQFNQHMMLYKGYISKTNDITHRLESGMPTANAIAGDASYRGLKNGETYSIDGVILHEEYFGNMTKSHTVVCTKTAHVLDKTFGDYNNFIETFKKCANAARGWCILAYEQRTKSFRIIMQDTHDNGVITMAFPIIVLDMYEHAYFYDYQTDKKKYIDAFITSIDWNIVERRISKVV